MNLAPGSIYSWEELCVRFTANLASGSIYPIPAEPRGPVFHRATLDALLRWIRPSASWWGRGGPHRPKRRSSEVHGAPRVQGHQQHGGVQGADLRFVCGPIPRDPPAPHEGGLLAGHQASLWGM
jgi:hypothetical protein